MAPTTHLELWTRAESTWTVGRQEAVVDRVRDLADDGVVDGVEVHLWNKQVPRSASVTATETDERARQRLVAFEAWAADAGTDLPAFAPTRRVGRGRMGPEVALQTLPLAVVAAYEDDDLVFVAPCTDGDTHYAVTDYLDHLADGGALDPTDEAGTDRHAVPA